LFSSNIKSSLDAINDWPIMDRNNCHGGTWINRARQENVFSKVELDKLEKAHEEVYLIANIIQHKFLGGDLAGARDLLIEYRSAFDIMSKALGNR